ncbi:MAG TPA: DUF5317 domain-containing protein [Egibacteraceae bacterium]|nr:DUF5317 domain-containing protein [Egibacteraceae bacterium]
MSLVLLTVVAAMAIGYVVGGRLANMASVSLRGTWLLAVAVAAQGILAAVSGAGGPVTSVGPALLLTSHAALLGFMWRNRWLPGMPLIFIGIVMNIAVIAANGAMPVSREAILAISPDAAFDPGKHRILEDGDRLTFLADLYPVRPIRAVISLGDVLLAVGAAQLVVALMRGGVGRRGRHSRTAAAMGRLAGTAGEAEDEAQA